LGNSILPTESRGDKGSVGDPISPGIYPLTCNEREDTINMQKVTRPRFELPSFDRFAAQVQAATSEAGPSESKSSIFAHPHWTIRRRRVLDHSKDVRANLSVEEQFEEAKRRCNPWCELFSPPYLFQRIVLICSTSERPYGQFLQTTMCSNSSKDPLQSALYLLY